VTLNTKCLCVLVFLDTLSARNQAGCFLSCGISRLSYVISGYAKGWNIQCTVYLDNDSQFQSCQARTEAHIVVLLRELLECSYAER